MGSSSIRESIEIVHYYTIMGSGLLVTGPTPLKYFLTMFKNKETWKLHSGTKTTTTFSVGLSKEKTTLKLHRGQKHHLLVSKKRKV